MDGWEDKLGAILGDPQAMGKIMELAQSLETEGRVPPRPEPVSQEGPELDPRLLEIGLRALSACQEGDDRRTRLLEALRPFVKPERYAKVDKAVRIARLSRAARQVLEGLKGGEEDV